MNPQERFCPNLACPAKGRVDEGNIVIHSQKERRYKCKVCRKTFTKRRGRPSNAMKQLQARWCS